MLLWRVFARMFLLGVMFQAHGVVSAQDFPNKPIRIVTTPIGGTGDLVSRLIAQGLTVSLGKQVIVDNRGGNVAIIAGIISNSQADGYSLMLTGSNLWVGPLLQEAPYDPVKDFSPLMLVTSSPFILVVNPSLPVNSVKELIALAKSKPGELNYGTSGTGTGNHLAAELFQAMAGVRFVRIDYKGVTAGINDLIAGRVQLSFANAAAGVPLIKSGKLRGLAVTSRTPTALVPGLPTVAAAGLPDFESDSVLGMFAPARTPDAIINRLNQEIGRVLNRAEVKEQLLGLGVQAIGSSPQQFALTIKAEMARLGKLIKDADIRDQ